MRWTLRSTLGLKAILMNLGPGREKAYIRVERPTGFPEIIDHKRWRELHGIGWIWPRKFRFPKLVPKHTPRVFSRRKSTFGAITHHTKRI